MKADEIRKLKPELDRFLGEFSDCFGQESMHEHLGTYVQGQLSDLPRKSIEPIALAAGEPPRTLQEFLSLFEWNESLMRDRLERRVACRRQSDHSVGVFDDTSCPKKGKKSPGVQRQYCGATGKTDNCVVTVHLAYAADDFHCLLDSELYLPESWDKDRTRCREAHIPDDIVYRPKWKIGLELYDQALRNGIHFSWVTFDEGYGGKPGFLDGLSNRKQLYVGEVPKNIHGWIDEPDVTSRPYRKEEGGGHRRTRRVVAGQKTAQSLEYHLQHGETFIHQRWTPWLIKEGTQGPMVWQIKHSEFFPRDERGLPAERQHLIVARNVLNPDEIKYFLSNAPKDAGLGTMLLVAFSRWNVERCFEDEKTELGFDHYEGRNYRGMKRHQIITALSHLFLAEQELRMKKNGRNALSAPHCHGGAHPLVVAEPQGVAPDHRENGGRDSAHAA